MKMKTTFILLTLLAAGLTYDPWDDTMLKTSSCQKPTAQMPNCNRAANSHPLPQFRGVLVEPHFWDSYWTESFDVNNDGRVDVFSSGLFSGEIYWYENPKDTANEKWTRHNVARLEKPVSMEHIDVDRDGLIDIIVTYDYGNCIADCDPKQGRVAWLKNPGQGATGNWTLYHIGNLMAGHRLKLGNFTGSQHIELMGLPIVGKPMNATVALTLFKSTDSLMEPWEATLVDDTLHFVHGVVKRSNFETGLDSLVIASQEGILHMFYKNQKWHKAIIGTGAQDMQQFKGSGDVDVGKMNDDPFDYIAAVEPFHGNEVAVYRKTFTSPTDLAWSRTVLDNFGVQDPKSFEGVGHHLLTADFDGDCEDEFIVALRGPMPYQGVFYYDPIDVSKSLFTKTRVSSESAARMTIADFNNDNKLDFASIGYAVKGYYENPNPQLWVFLNEIH